MGKVAIESYTIKFEQIEVGIAIERTDEDFVPHYIAEVTNVSKPTLLILDNIREEFINKSKLSTQKAVAGIKDRFKNEIRSILNEYFPDLDNHKIELLVNYVIEQNLGLGHVEVLLRDPALEEIVINNSSDPVWVYHRKHGWCKTNITIPDEDRIRHYSTLIGRDINKEITLLSPLMDAHLKTGDRVNATLYPISTKGNTITIRKFAADPWTITDFLNSGTIDADAAALIWLGIEHELSILIAGGTGSGKTSMLNVIANFLPPNHRVISIEDTRELTLPNMLHWVPLETRLPNPEGKGEVSMLDLLVNSLRMRPDRIVVGEIRRKKEAEVLFEAMHTGHSVYATIHANTAPETVARLTNPPIDVPKLMLASLSMIIVQNRDRKTGKRRTFQVAQVTSAGDAQVIMQYDIKTDKLKKVKEPNVLYETLGLYTGMSKEQVNKNLAEKKKILAWIVQKKIKNVHDIGLVVSLYYQGKSISDFEQALRGRV